MRLSGGKARLAPTGMLCFSPQLVRLIGFRSQAGNGLEDNVGLNRRCKVGLTTGSMLRLTAISLLLIAGRVFPSHAQTETTLYSFGSFTNDGANPVGGLLLGGDGNFYSTTSSGGTSNRGTVFRISPNGSYTNLYSFSGPPSDGASPSAGLVLGGNGNFYGTTQDGGTSTNCGGGCGTVFRISSSGVYTNLHSFTGAPNDGAYPAAPLIQGSDSNFYGTTSSGGTSNSGTVFRISLDGVCTTLHSFSGYPKDGATPDGALVQIKNGNLYGTTYSGGRRDEGTVFRISPSGTYRVLRSIGKSRKDGWNPYAGLVKGSDGNLYGTTLSDNGGGYGTIFRISPSGAYKTLHHFDPNNPVDDGWYPYDTPVEGHDGNLYGTTSSGGSPDCQCGTLYRINPSRRRYDLLYSFVAFGSSVSDGGVPCGPLVQTSDGSFYGTTRAGGSKNEGTVFKFTAPSGELCTYKLSTTAITIPARSESETVRVKVSSTNCAWTAVSNEPFIATASHGTGDGEVFYIVYANGNPTERFGSITIGDQRLMITQAAEK